MNDELAPQFKMTVRILHLAMLGSVVMYGVVAYVVAPQQEASVEISNAFVLALATAAVFVLAASLWLPGFIVGEDKVLSAMRSAPDDPLPAGSRLFMTAFILRLALIEAIAVFGLVAALLAADPVYFIGFGVAAFLFMALASFDEDRLFRIYRRL